VQRSILVEAPVADSFAFWSDTENFHTFMEGVGAVTRLDSETVRWRAHTEDGPREWETTLALDAPARTISWSHADGRETGMTITFAPLEGNSCWIVCTIEVDTAGMGGDLAELLGRTSRRLERDMRSARDHIEQRYLASKPSKSCKRA
jgi:uncharacterized membrane protein